MSFASSVPTFAPGSASLDIMAGVYFGVFFLGLWPCFAVWVGYISPLSRRRSEKNRQGLALKVLLFPIAVGVLLWMTKFDHAAAFYFSYVTIALYVISLVLSYRIALAKGSRVPGIWPLAVFGFGAWAFIALLVMRKQNERLTADPSSRNQFTGGPTP